MTNEKHRRIRKFVDVVRKRVMEVSESLINSNHIRKEQRRPDNRYR